MDAHGSSEDREGPQWVPYTPPTLSGWDRVRVVTRRLAFPLVLLVVLAGVVAVFYWGESLSRLESLMTDTVDSTSPVQRIQEGDPGPSDLQLTVRSSPPGATVRLNGDSIGVTPLVNRTVKTGSYLLSLRLEGHFRADTVVVLGDQRPAAVRLSLRSRPGYLAPDSESAAPDPGPSTRPERSVPRTAVPSSPPPSTAQPEPSVGGLHVTSVPGGALVTVDGTPEGRTPVSISDVPTGPAQVSLSLADYEPWSTQITVSEGTTRRVHADLEQATGRLRVLARPWGTIYIDGRLEVREQDVWYETTLPVGGHEVRVVHPILGTQNRQVQVPANGEVSVVVDLRSEAAAEGNR